MIVVLKKLLGWWVRLVMPIMGWRVPVRLLCGPARESAREVRLLAAGGVDWTAYLTGRFFAGEPVVEETRHVPVWRLQQQVDEWQSRADLVVIGIDRLSARVFLRRDYLRVPQWVSAWMQVPQNLETYEQQHSRAESDFRRVRKQGFESSLSMDEADFDVFYDQFFQPYLQSRHQVAAPMAPRWMLRLVFQLGAIQWESLKGMRVAADLVVREGRDYVPVVTGLHEGREELRRQGALVALYAHAPQHARALGCTRILLGGCKPCLHDGVLRYKSKWLDGLCDHDGHLSGNHVMLLCWNRLAGPVAEFLSHTALIHHEQGGYSALWVFPAHLPLAAETLHKELRELQVKGLRNLRIILPGMPPPDFKAPPGVLCLELAIVDQAGGEGICGYTKKK
jgi:Acetyltransferase (GNAT) domain